MKLLLKDDVKNLGKTGDVVTVKDGYGRNYLLPYGYAMPVTPGNLRAIEAEKKRRQEDEAKLVDTLKELAERIAGLDITISALVSEGEALYGAVQEREIADALKEEGVEVEVDSILPTEPIKSLGVHRVPVKLHSQVETELKVWIVEKKEGE